MDQDSKIFFPKQNFGFKQDVQRKAKYIPVMCQSKICILSFTFYALPIPSCQSTQLLI